MLRVKMLKYFSNSWHASFLICYKIGYFINFFFILIALLFNFKNSNI